MFSPLQEVNSHFVWLSLVQFQVIGCSPIRYVLDLLSYSSCVGIKSRKWSVKQQLYHQQSVVEPGCHLTSSGDKSRQCGTSFAFHHKDTNQWFYFFLQAPQWLCAVWKWLSRDHCCHGRLKPGCRIVGSSTREKLTTWADLTSDVHTYQVLPQRLPGWETGTWRVGNIRMNWPVVVCYNLLHELLCGSLSMESRWFNVGENW